MTPLASLFLLIGLTLGAIVLARALRVGDFNFTLKKQPPAVKVHPELLAQMRSEIVHDAVKRGRCGARIGFTRNQ